MKDLVPPLLLVLSLGAFIAGFAALTVEGPQPSVELHRARAVGDDRHREALEAGLDRARRRRWVQIGSLFGLGAVLAATALLAMRP